VASKTRTNAVLQYLHEANLTEEQIARLKHPAGLDLGSITPEEIALSILAEIVQRRRQLPRSTFQPPDPTFSLPMAPGPPTEALNPSAA
jgi:xanthine/CO dehydrogenase XdhC/CoxF family maturation factor